MVAPDLIADLLGFGQRGSPLWFLPNVISPGHIVNPLNPTGRRVGVTIADEAEHAAEARLGEPQRAAAAVLFVFQHHDLQLAVNLRGLFLVTQAAIPLLRESQGWIVNLASIAGTLPTPGLATYGATKAAVIALTRSLNDELDGDGVRAIALCPGFVDTPMAQWSGIEPDEMIRPEDCAEVVRMCLRLSPHARIPQVVIERMGSRNGDVQ